MRAAGFRYFRDPPLALAHRGGAGYQPNLGLENTLAAFRTALDLGYRHLETDVHLSADGIAVIIHDPTLDRVTDSHGEVRHIRADVITAAKVGGREPIPLLSEVLAALPDAFLTIDLKAAGTPLAVWREIQQHRAQDRVCVGSFSNLRLWRFRRLARGRVATSAGWLGCLALRLLPAALTDVLHSPAPVYQVPEQVEVAGWRLTVVTAEFVRRAHRLGKQVHVWTVDDPAQQRRLLDRGVDGLVSDRIEVLREVLRRRGQWPGPD